MSDKLGCPPGEKMLRNTGLEGRLSYVFLTQLMFDLLYLLIALRLDTILQLAVLG